RTTRPRPLLEMMVALAAAAGQAAPAPAALGFEAAVRRALERNPAAEVANEEVRRAEALLVQARAQSLPSITGTVTYTRLDDDRILNGRVIAGANQLSATGAVQVPLILPRGWVAWSHASNNVEVARLG